MYTLLGHITRLLLHDMNSREVYTILVIDLSASCILISCQIIVESYLEFYNHVCDLSTNSVQTRT